ncbi:Kelch repeat-containing protein [Microbulbifer sp. TYP-18]|uniref:Kelch repeat-containing protein n=1 Tax=Microbulbifer sp. TYP-18 TaxID=3230024 RepID=UPI0034C65448
MNFSRRNFIKFAGLAPLLYGGIVGMADPARKKSRISLTSLTGLDSPIQEIYPAVFEEEAYVAGGFSPSPKPIFYGLSPTKYTYIFSPKTKTWRSGPALPEVRHHLGMAANSKYLYGIGGFYGQKGSVWQAKGTVHRFSSGESWVSAPDLPQPMAESVYASISEDIHVIGGKSPGDLSRNADTKSHYILIDNTDWEMAAPTAIRRNSAAGAVVENRIYVVGGRQVSSDGRKARNLSYSEVYDPRLDKWEKIRPLPEAVAGLTASSLNGRVIAIGGEAFGPNGNWKTGTAYSVVWVYDPISDQWCKEALLNEARHGHGAVVIDDTLYIIGGASQVGPQNTLASVVQLRWNK